MAHIAADRLPTAGRSLHSPGGLSLPGECGFILDLLRGVSEMGKKSHFLSIRRLFEGVLPRYMTEKRHSMGKKGPF